MIKIFSDRRDRFIEAEVNDFLRKNPNVSYTLYFSTANTINGCVEYSVLIDYKKEY